jgi:hypothetical protein
MSSILRRMDKEVSATMISKIREDMEKKKQLDTEEYNRYFKSSFPTPESYRDYIKDIQKKRDEDRENFIKKRTKEKNNIINVFMFH